jgi:hypothetical protein
VCGVTTARRVFPICFPQFPVLASGEACRCIDFTDVIFEGSIYRHHLAEPFRWIIFKSSLTTLALFEWKISEHQQHTYAYSFFFQSAIILLLSLHTSSCYSNFFCPALFEDVFQFFCRFHPSYCAPWPYSFDLL